ncbi:leucine-rich repeat-containing protein 69 isoform X2 [Moschus berezovskii]|uniref:leucine-rich repeat-containing protein 69 isoform X2 n=1 Tax=Moschus berezovskii TaxID=68408 RepID=UPI0024442CD3|nr:leucine-rich repeat-containing protein 69 isoform X2 [Moschus berezovskii]
MSMSLLISICLQLTVLNLGNNLLEEVPEEMKYLTSLKTLHLFRNKIHRFASGVCDGLQSLILLNLNNNQLTWIPQEISRPSSKCWFFQSACEPQGLYLQLQAQTIKKS